MYNVHACTYRQTDTLTVPAPPAVPACAQGRCVWPESCIFPELRPIQLHEIPASGTGRGGGNSDRDMGTASACECLRASIACIVSCECVSLVGGPVVASSPSPSSAFPPPSPSVQQLSPAPEPAHTHTHTHTKLLSAYLFIHVCTCTCICLQGHYARILRRLYMYILIHTCTRRALRRSSRCERRTVAWRERTRTITNNLSQFHITYAQAAAPLSIISSPPHLGSACTPPEALRSFSLFV